MELSKTECKIILELLSLAALDNEGISECNDLKKIINSDKEIKKTLQKMADENEENDFDDNDKAEISTHDVQNYIEQKLEKA